MNKSATFQRGLIFMSFEWQRRRSGNSVMVSGTADSDLRRTNSRVSDTCHASAKKIKMGRDLVGWENLFFLIGIPEASVCRICFCPELLSWNCRWSVLRTISCFLPHHSTVLSGFQVGYGLKTSWTEESFSTEYIVDPDSTTLAEFINVSRRRRMSSLRHSTTLPCYPRLPSSFARCWTSWIWWIMFPAMKVAISFLHTQSRQLQWLQVLTAFIVI